MVSLMNITLIRHEQLSSLQRAQLLDIELTAAQQSLTGDIHGALHALTAKPDCDIQGYGVLVDEVPRGFFLLKRRSLLPSWADAHSATLHALMIDRRFQGLGLGKHCVQALPALVSGLWANIDQLMLGVDSGNDAAHSLYRSLGWKDAGNASPAVSGYEQRMVLDLTAAPAP